ncbi:MAG TPA: DUF6599 family protein, partial [Chthonomonadaceae bacterium]|nr:DUF6599 family protein [Chthonomonadaceae bacterium]
MPVWSLQRRFSSRLSALLAGCGLIMLPAFARVARADTRSALPPTVGDFKMTRPAQIYTPATLENHIDGEAEAVKHYDFKECAYGEYAPKGVGNQLITVDIYQMADPQGAWGYYSGQVNPNAKQVTVGGAHGYQEATALNFWKGPYYVKVAITASKPGPFQPAMPKIAAAIATKLSGSTSVPSIVQLLPPGYKPYTEQYRRSDIAAQSYIRNGVLAQYPAAGTQAELFIAIFTTPAAAKDAFGKYRSYLTEPRNIAVGAKANPIKGIGDEAIGV